MKVNIISLRQALNNKYPSPKGKNDTLKILIPNRLSVLNKIDEVQKELTLTATKYCTSTHCWYEWEIEL